MGTVVGNWRLKAILILLVFISFTYTAYTIFNPDNIVAQTSGSVNEEGYIDYNQSGINSTLVYNESDITIEDSQSFIDAMVGVGDFLTFGGIDNVWARLIFNFIIGMCWISIGYIIYTFFKEWIPFV